MDRIKAGVIGTGFIGPAHIEALRRLGNIDVVALTDIGYNGAACVEVEDRSYEGSLQMRKKSLIQSREYLKPFVA